MHSSTVSVLVGSRRSILGGGALRWRWVSWSPIRARNSHTTAAIATMQNAPIARWVGRQP